VNKQTWTQSVILIRDIGSCISQRSDWTLQQRTSRSRSTVSSNGSGIERSTCWCHRIEHLQTVPVLHPGVTSRSMWTGKLQSATGLVNCSKYGTDVRGRASAVRHRQIHPEWCVVSSPVDVFDCSISSCPVDVGVICGPALSYILVFILIWILNFDCFHFSCHLFLIYNYILLLCMMYNNRYFIRDTHFLDTQNTHRYAENDTQIRYAEYTMRYADTQNTNTPTT